MDIPPDNEMLEAKRRALWVAYLYLIQEQDEETIAALNIFIEKLLFDLEYGIDRRH